MSKALMIQGTGSGVGKSLIVAGLCRIFRDMGINVAPFKAQNMALNSFITKEGGEIGRAQALQAEAAGIEPSVDMNPILLKASSDSECQVIVNGKVHSNMKAGEYYSFKEEAWEAVKNAYKRLSTRYDLIMIEGAGSPAEINLMDDEIVNMSVARYTDAPVILVGDIDRGGVFASFYGTVGLLDGDADYIKAYIINKFRGDIEILKPGIRMIYEKTSRPVIGVIPYLGDLRLHEEDGIPLERLKNSRVQELKGSKIKIVVVRLRYISNFTDFDPFMYEPDVEFVYSLWRGDIENADLLIIPGSKNTVEDLLFLRNNGIEKSIKLAVEKGIPLIGLCGGYQMLGKKIFDPFGVESRNKEVKGIGLLDIETTFEKMKITSQVEATLVKSLELGVQSKNTLKGYEIHMGVSKGDVGLFNLSRLWTNEYRLSTVKEGSVKGNVWGTYIHGIFDNDRFRHNIINSLRI
ncbi:MAG: cobyric acid synthase, partial [Nitrospirae bacterium]|nr:cobyric acid synthase [Nitrospirota bacterium]